MSTRRLLAAVASALALVVTAHAQGSDALTVEVFVNSAMHVTPAPSAELPYQYRVYRLDAMQNVLEQINQQLPQSEEQAQAWIAANQQRIRKQLAPGIQTAAQGMTLAVGYRLNRLPAIVINRRVVVYGVTDAHRAVGLAREQLGATQQGDGS